MIKSLKAWAAIQSTQGGIIRARRQHGMSQPPEAYNSLFSGQKHTCIHIMSNLRCSGFEAAARVAAMLYWAVRRTAESTNTPELMELAQLFKDSVIMALSKDGEAGAGSRRGVWQPTTIADEIIKEMETSYQETCFEITKMLSQRMEGTAGKLSNPYSHAVELAAKKFAWSADELENFLAEVSNWTLAEAHDLIEEYGIGDGIEDTPWEINPLFTAGLHIARYDALQDLKVELRQDHRVGDDALHDLNPLDIMLAESTEIGLVDKYLQITEALFEVTGIEWSEEIKDNAKFFADNIDRTGLEKEQLVQTMVKTVRRIASFAQEKGA